jgi:hypothetical protein
MLATTISDQIYVQEEFKNGLNLTKAFHYSLQNLVSSLLLSKANEYSSVQKYNCNSLCVWSLFFHIKRRTQMSDAPLNVGAYERGSDKDLEQVSQS